MVIRVTTASSPSGVLAITVYIPDAGRLPNNLNFTVLDQSSNYNRTIIIRIDRIWISIYFVLIKIIFRRCCIRDKAAKSFSCGKIDSTC